MKTCLTSLLSGLALLGVLTATSPATYAGAAAPVGTSSSTTTQGHAGGGGGYGWGCNNPSDLHHCPPA